MRSQVSSHVEAGKPCGVRAVVCWLYSVGLSVWLLSVGLSTVNCQMDSPQSFSPDDVAQHCSHGDIWIIIDHDVYDLSTFMDEHPGGSKSMSPELCCNIAYRSSPPRSRRERRDEEVQEVSSRVDSHSI